MGTVSTIVGVEAAQKAGAKLIITVDCGIGSFEAAAHAQSLGIDLIITDHHEPTRKESAKCKVQRIPEDARTDTSRYALLSL